MSITHRSIVRERVAYNTGAMVDQFSASDQPTDEQLADRVGRDDGIRPIRPNVIARLRRYRIYLLTKAVQSNIVPSQFAKGECEPRDHRNGYWVVHVQTGTRYGSILAAAAAVGVKPISIRRSLKGRRVPSLNGHTFEHVKGGRRSKYDLRQLVA